MFVFRVIRAALRLTRRDRRSRATRQAISRYIDSPSLRVPATAHCVPFDVFLPAVSVHYHYGSAGQLQAYEGSECPRVAATGHIPATSRPALGITA